MHLYDAHNHLQDERFDAIRDELVSECATTGVERMVVNGSCEADWPEVIRLSQRHAMVMPSVGYHPWYLADRSPRWREMLVEVLDRSWCAVGEIGLDRWKPGLSYADQEETFRIQLELAAE